MASQAAWKVWARAKWMDLSLCSNGSNLSVPSLLDLRPLLSCVSQSVWALSSGFSKTLLRKSVFTVKPWCSFKALRLWVWWASRAPWLYHSHNDREFLTHHQVLDFCCFDFDSTSSFGPTSKFHSRATAGEIRTDLHGVWRLGTCLRSRVL